MIDRSGVTPDAASNQIAAANANRKYLLIQNNDAATEFWVDFGSAAVVGQPSVQVAPGATFLWEAGFIPSDAIHLIASAAAVTYTVKEG